MQRHASYSIVWIQTKKSSLTMLGGMQAEINRGQCFADLGAYATSGSALGHKLFKKSIIYMRKLTGH